MLGLQLYAVLAIHGTRFFGDYVADTILFKVTHQENPLFLRPFAFASFLRRHQRAHRRPEERAGFAHRDRPFRAIMTTRFTSS